MLQVWIPGIENLNNQGLLQLPSPSYNSMTQNNYGKIGKCYKGMLEYHLSNDPLTTNQVSVACWIKGDSFNPYNNIIFCANTSDSEDSKYYFSIINNTTLNFGINSSYTYSISYTFATDIWYHIAATYDGDKIRLYVNGELKGTSNSLNIIPRTALNYGIMCRSYNSTGTSVGGWNQYYNDFRLYDSVLSSKQVHEIAKGLVLHYPMNDEYITNNLFKGTKPIKKVGGNSTFSYTENQYFKILDNYDGKVSVIHKHRDGITSTSWFEAPQYQFCDNTILKPNQQYTWSFWQKGTNQGGFFRIYQDGIVISSAFTSSIKTINGWTLHSLQFTMPSSYTNMYFTNTVEKNCDLYLTDWKLEEGWNDNPVWTPNKEEDPNFYKVYDCSGYCNNGTVTGSLQVVDDSPRYKKSVKIINSTISHPLCLSNNNQEWTCCAWIKPTSQSGNQYLNNFNIGNMIYHEGTYPLLWLNYSTNDYYNYGNLKPNINEWTHIAFVFKNSTGYKHIFINGEDATNTSGPNKTTTPYGLPSTITLFSGFNGQVSDYREYSTALSEDDIKELYNTSAIINNNNTLQAYEFSEADTYSINKSGVLEGAEFIEQDGNVQINNTEQVFATEFTEI